jgi:hypothetical protein
MQRLVTFGLRDEKRKGEKDKQRVVTFGLRDGRRKGERAVKIRYEEFSKGEFA